MHEDGDSSRGFHQVNLSLLLLLSSIDLQICNYRPEVQPVLHSLTIKRMGISPERFEKPDAIPEAFHCGICLEVFRDPWAVCVEAEHVFCKEVGLSSSLSFVLLAGLEN